MKKILSLLMVITILFGMFVIPVHADDVESVLDDCTSMLYYHLGVMNNRSFDFSKDNFENDISDLLFIEFNITKYIDVKYVSDGAGEYGEFLTKLQADACEEIIGKLFPCAESVITLLKESDQYIESEDVYAFSLGIGIGPGSFYPEMSSYKYLGDGIYEVWNDVIFCDEEGWFNDSLAGLPAGTVYCKYRTVIKLTDGVPMYIRYDTYPCYKDVTEDAPYYDAVAYLYQRHLMEGTGTLQFSPDYTLNRATVVTVLYRLEGEPYVDYNCKTFSDVNSDDWYHNAVEWAAEKGIVEGFGNGLFKPKDAVTNEQLAAIMQRYANYKGIKTDAAQLLPIEADVSSWAKDSVAWAASNGLLTDEQLRAAKATATRAQVAVTVYNYIQNFEA